MKITKEQTPYFMVDFTDELVGANSFMIQLNAKTIDRLKSFKNVAQDVSKECGSAFRIEFEECIGDFLRIDLQKEKNLKAWFDSGKKNTYIDATKKEIDVLIERYSQEDVEYTVSVYVNSERAYFIASMIDTDYNSIVAYQSAAVDFSEIGIE